MLDSLDSLTIREIEATNGSPLDWPTDLPPEYAPARIEEQLKVARESCPKLLRFTRLDCDEFPCLLWVDTPEDGEAPSRSTCDAWSFPATPVRIGAASDSRGTLSNYSIFALIPAGSVARDEQDNGRRRIERRIQDLIDEIYGEQEGDR